jgi:hydroxymethylpyrimidine kinase/phosphomethylpyrimidine kinase/thiamine-phosphate diphosphorylase
MVSVPAFPDCGPAPLGLYPVVDSLRWLERLLPLGITTIQLRIKDKHKRALESEIEQSIALARQYNARLFINDHWELAVRHQAYGVHLGQEDLPHADIDRLRGEGLRLGISVCYHDEVARAEALRPSYLAFGPIYPTTSKETLYPPLGTVRLKHWRSLLKGPLVAIGGITLERTSAVLAAGANGIAVISAITQAEDPEHAAKALMEVCGG